MKKHVMTGLVMLLPLTLTVWIVSSLIDWLTHPFIGITGKILSSLDLAGSSIFFLNADQVLNYCSKAFVLLFLFVFIVLIGAIGRYVFFRYMLRISDRIIHKIPIISGVYKTSQELIQTILASDNRAFKQVVLVPFPNADCFTIGLVTREGAQPLDRVPVFVPTTPNPTSGYLILYDRSKIVPLAMSVEEAFRYIVSCGVLVSKEAFSQVAEQETSS